MLTEAIIDRPVRRPNAMPIMAGTAATAERIVPKPELPAPGIAAARLEATHLEGLLLNLDDALRVRTRAQFFAWTQGLLQSLIPHRALVCALRRGSSRAFAFDGFSTVVGDAAQFGEVLVRETPLASVLTESWRQHRHQPVLCGINDFSQLATNATVRELRRLGVTDLLVHGNHDADGEVQSMCVFACQSGAIGSRELYLVQLIAPSLHAAWMRTQSRVAAEDMRLAASGNGTLTERERGILRWVYLGKSNGEIGAILNISALTVKNHMQKILRKLNVVNRAQAVGKALDARIIRP
jgi:transcriptional regulator EpsA